MNDFLPGDLSDWSWWMIFAVMLAIGEIVLPGIFLIWIAIAAAITGALAFALPVLFPAQMLLFAALSLIAAYAGKRWYRDNPVASTDPLLNDRAARLIGRLVTVTDPIVGGEGRVKVDDGTWTAIGPDAPQGARMTVVATNGPVLTVDWPAA